MGYSKGHSDFFMQNLSVLNDKCWDLPFCTAQVQVKFVGVCGHVLVMFKCMDCFLGFHLVFGFKEHGFQIMGKVGILNTSTFEQLFGHWLDRAAC